MKVAMVCPYSMSRPGGVQGQVLGLARELRKIDVDVRIIAPCDGPPPDPSIVSVGPTIEWESNGSIAPIATGKGTARRTAEALRTIEPDVVHLHEPPVPGPSLNSLIGFSGPMIGTFHASGEVPHQWLRPPLRSFMMRLTFRVAVSESARETAAHNWNGDEYTVLWNGIEIDRIATAQAFPAARPAVLFLGRLEPRKGLDVLLDAWSGIERDAELWAIGAGPQGDELRARNVPGVHWLGTVSDAERNARLRGSTVFCAPSLRGESFGVVLLEAMAASTPIVASAIEGYQNVARADREARLVPPGDVGALRRALQELLDDETARARLVAAGHQRAEEFSMHRLAARYAELYDRSLVLA
jgi:phosphatidyl-myo-inositol alpha-mannosyltransferase